jgi:flavorubredoxin
MVFMVRVFVFYDSKYGNTKIVAEKVADGMRALGVVVDLGYIKEVSPEHVLDYDAFVLGAPNHMGRPSQAMKKFINHLSTLNLKNKKVAVFGTYSGKVRVIDRSVKKMERMVQEKLPNLTLISPSLSVRVKGVSGPVVDGELPKCVDFGKALVAQL